MHIVDRLVKGLKAEINMVDVKKQTSSRYEKLPECKTKKKEEERKSQAKARVMNVKAYDMKMRGKFKPAVKKE